MMGGSIVRAILSSQPGVLPHRSPAASCLKAVPTVLVPCLPGSRRGNHRKRCLPLGVGRRSLGAAGGKASVLGQCDGRLLQAGELVQPLDCRERVNHSDGTECRKRDMATRAGGDVPPGSTSVVSSPVAAKVKCVVPKLSFCPTCGGPIEQQIPEGEHELRDVCTICGAVHYQNPKMVVGCLVEHEDKVLLCRRAIKPSYGLWTFPSGFMELGESAAEGAARETWEEAHAQVEVLSLFAHLDIPLLGQSCIIFRAKLKQPDFSPGPESLECALFGLNDIPFEDLAFSSIHVVLKLYKDDIAAGSFHVHHGVIDKRPGADPSDPVAVRDHLVM